MKKILLAFDGNHFSEGALDFARQLNEKSPILLTGAFLPQVDFANLWSYSGGGESGKNYIPLLEDEDAEDIKQNIERFTAFCGKNKIEHRVHKLYFDFALPELKKETRYADLLIISSETFYEQAGTEQPNDYLQEALHEAECPVIVVPEKFDFPQNTVLTYNGSETCVFAIKQFAYLFPELISNDTVLIYVNDKDTDLLPEEANMEELTARHFPKLEVLRLEANPKRHFGTWLSEKNGAIVVSGAFGRSGISRAFRKSFLAEVIAEHRLPVFIAHK